MLKEQRDKIDKIDRELVRLFEERMSAVIEVAKIKKENSLEIFDAKREKIVIEKVKSYLKDKNLEKYLEEFYIDLMKVSKDYQRTIIGNRAGGFPKARFPL